MAELLVQSDSLTAIADAIREKAESTDPLVFPTGFIDALAAIGGGSGLPGGITALATGEYTPASDVMTTIAIRHNMAVMPNIYIAFSEESPIDTDTYKNYIVATIVIAKSASTGSRTFSRLDFARTGELQSSNFTTGAESTYGGIISTHLYIWCSSSFRLKAGATYRWVAAYIEGI